MGKMKLPPIQKHTKGSVTSTNLNLPSVKRDNTPKPSTRSLLPPIEKRAQGNIDEAYVDYVPLPKTLHNDIPKEISNHTEKRTKIHVKLLEILNELDKLKLFRPGGAFFTLQTTQGKQTILIYAPLKGEEKYGFPGAEVLQASITNTGIFSLGFKGPKLLKPKTEPSLPSLSGKNLNGPKLSQKQPPRGLKHVGKPFKEWLREQMELALKTFSEIHYKPSTEEVGEWILLNLVSLLSENKQQTAHIAAAPIAFRLKTELVTILTEELDEFSIENIRTEDPTGIFVYSIISMVNQYEQD